MALEIQQRVTEFASNAEKIITTTIKQNPTTHEQRKTHRSFRT
jgi:hypothetical protein